jgi:hypothetical protein
MTDWIPWFKYQLQASADGFAWAFSQISPSLLDQLPVEPGYLGTWTPLRHVWHLTGYEQCLVLPTMKQWPARLSPRVMPGMMRMPTGPRLLRKAPPR